MYLQKCESNVQNGNIDREPYLQNGESYSQKIDIDLQKGKCMWKYYTSTVLNQMCYS